MQDILNKLAETYIELFLKNNAALQMKKNALRKELAQKGVLKKEGKNDFDHYKYFSEAQYKELFTDLFSKHGLELKSSEISYTAFDGSQKQPFGRLVKVEFCLIDCDTGFYELSYVTGEGLDKGDKAGYKANTGAIKYYLADTFLVATGDDPENENNATTAAPQKTTKQPQQTTANKATVKQIQLINKQLNSNPDKVTKLLDRLGVSNINDLTVTQANAIIKKLIEQETESPDISFQKGE